MEQIKNVALKIWIIAQMPLGWLSAIGAYFLPLKGVYELIIAIVVADLITGIVASRIKKVPCSSRRLRQSVYKFLGYVGVIFLFYKFEKEIGIQDWICTYKLIAGFIFITEVISILENLAVITNNKIFLKIIKLIRGKASKDAKNGNIIDDILDEKNN